jgi:hypothetical protein
MPPPPIITCHACHTPGMAIKRMAKYSGCLQVLGIPLLLFGVVNLLFAMFLGLMSLAGANRYERKVETAEQIQERKAAEFISGVTKAWGVTAGVAGVLGLIAGGSLTLTKRTVWHCNACGSETARD